MDTQVKRVIDANRTREMLDAQRVELERLAVLQEGAELPGERNEITAKMRACQHKINEYQTTLEVLLK